MEPITLETNRLILRQWKASDFSGFADLNADPNVMAYYPSVLTESQSNQLARKLESLIDEKAWGMWAVELKCDGRFMGFVGLHEPAYDLPVTPCVEIGWRLAQEFWGKGYASEAASKVLNFSFNHLNLKQVYSFTSVVNVRSQAVMARLGMANMGCNFEHPMVEEGHRLREHVLFCITEEQWLRVQPERSS